MTAPIAIRRLNAADADFAQHLDHLLSWESVSDDAVNQRVLEIIKAVRERGDAAQFRQYVDVRLCRIFYWFLVQQLAVCARHARVVGVAGGIVLGLLPFDVAARVCRRSGVGGECHRIGGANAVKAPIATTPIG